MSNTETTPQATAAPKFNEAGLLTLETKVSKSEGKKRVEIGALTYYVPLLSALGIAVEPKTYDEDGLPVYETDAQNWLWNSVHAAVKAAARNKLQSGTATVKDGAKVAETLPELMAEAERGGNAAYLAAIQAIKAKFAVWVQSLGKSKATQDLLRGLFASPKNIALQAPNNRPKFAAYVTDFADTLEAAELEGIQKYLQNLIDACEAPAEDAEDF